VEDAGGDLGMRPGGGVHQLLVDFFQLRLGAFAFGDVAEIHHDATMAPSTRWGRQ